MPNSVMESEEAVVGAILIDAACLPAVLGILSADDFELEICRTIFVAARDLDRAGAIVDAVTISHELQRCGSPVSREFLQRLMEVTPTAANVEEYATIVRKASQRRQLIELADIIADRAKSIEDPSEIIGDALKRLDEIDAKSTGEVMSSAEAVVEYYEYRDKIESGTSVAVPSGFSGLDRVLGGGFLNEGLYFIAARPGVGKTTLGLSIADNVAESVGPVLFVSLEMSSQQLTAKRLSRCSGISSAALLTQSMSGDMLAHKRIAEAGKFIGSQSLYYNKKLRCTVSDLRGLARKASRKAKRNLSMIVVDYVGLLRPEGKVKDKYEGVSQISNDLKMLARTLGIPILAMCQLNRANENRAAKRPALSDLRDSGSLEQDADGVILLHREDYYEGERVEVGEIELNVAKNRHAGDGMVNLVFDKRNSAFCETI